MNEIRNIIRQVLLERFNFNNNKTFYPPENVKATAKKALSMAGQASHGGNEGSGKRKAQELASGQQQSHAQMKRLKAFFDANQPGSPEWELHGGNDAKNWVEQSLSTTHDSNMRTKEQMRRVGGAGYGSNEGMGTMDANMMNPTNQRNHSVWTRVKNMEEAFVDKEGNLQQFQSDEEERAEEIHQFKTEFSMFMYGEANSGMEVNGFKLEPDETAYGYFTWIYNLNPEYSIETFLFPYPKEKSVLGITLLKEMENGGKVKVEETLIKIPHSIQLHTSPDEMLSFLTKNLSVYIDDLHDRGRLIGL